MAAFFLWIVNVHNHKKCAVQQSRCINLLLLPQCLCTQEGVHLTQLKTARGVQRSKLTEDYSGSFVRPRSGAVAIAWQQPLCVGPSCALVKLQRNQPRVAQIKCTVPSMSIPSTVGFRSTPPQFFATTVTVVHTSTSLGLLPPDGARSNRFKTSRTQRRRVS